VFDRCGCKAIAQRSPDFQFLARKKPRQAAGHLATDQIDDLHADRLARGVENSVIKCQRSSEQRIVATRQPQH
jgi:hypothetical protein